MKLAKLWSQAGSPVLLPEHANPFADLLRARAPSVSLVVQLAI